jgi:hypothetical protein
MLLHIFVHPGGPSKLQPQATWPEKQRRVHTSLDLAIMSSLLGLTAG